MSVNSIHLLRENVGTELYKGLDLDLVLKQNQRTIAFLKTSRQAVHRSRFLIFCICSIDLDLHMSRQRSKLFSNNRKIKQHGNFRKLHFSPFFLSARCFMNGQFHNFLISAQMAKSIVYVITLITNRNHAFHCLNQVRLSFYHKPISHWIKIDHVDLPL